MFPDFSLQGKTALITGAGRGIGQAIALTLAEAGADVALSARTLSQLEGTAQQISRLGRRGLPIPCDVTQPSQVEEMAQKALEGLGSIDILITSHGTIFMRPLVAIPDKSFLSQVLPGFEGGTSLEEWDGVIDLNYRGTVLVIRAVAPHMMARRQGKVLLITSTESTQAWSYHSAYASGKAALMMLTRVLAKEWARYGITVNAIAPGFYRTAASEFSYQDQRLVDTQLRMIPLRRFGNLRELGLLAVYLSSEAANYITGQSIFIDGGVSA